MTYDVYSCLKITSRVDYSLRSQANSKQRRNVFSAALGARLRPDNYSVHYIEASLTLRKPFIDRTLAQAVVLTYIYIYRALVSLKIKL